MSDDNQSQSVEPTSDSPDGGRNYEEEIKALRAEAAKYRVERNEARGKLEELSPLAKRAQELEEAGKSELQKLAEQQAQLQKELQDAKNMAALATKRQKLTTLAAQQGVNPAVLGFLDVNAFNLEDEAATTEALKAFATNNKPSGGSASNPANNGQRPAETDEDRRIRLFGGSGRSIFDMRNE